MNPVLGREAVSASREDPDRILLGNLLRKMREQHGLSRDDLGAAIGHTGSTIANIETGYRAPTPEQARALDRVFKQPGTFEDLEKRLHGLPFSSGFRPFPPYEAEATVMRMFENLLIPGLFQEADYARAILATHPDATPELIEERLQGRLDRQRVLVKERPPRLWVLLDAGVLYREIGSQKVMASQLRRLVHLAQQPNITIQILTAKAHSGLNGAFVTAEIPGRHVGYMETIVDGMTVEEPGLIGTLEVRFDTLRTEALKGTESLALMERVADEYEQGDELA